MFQWTRCSAIAAVQCIRRVRDLSSLIAAAGNISRITVEDADALLAQQGPAACWNRFWTRYQVPADRLCPLGPNTPCARAAAGAARAIGCGVAHRLLAGAAGVCQRRSTPACPACPPSQVPFILSCVGVVCAVAGLLTCCCFCCAERPAPKASRQEQQPYHQQQGGYQVTDTCIALHCSVCGCLWHATPAHNPNLPGAQLPEPNRSTTALRPHRKPSPPV